MIVIRWQLAFPGEPVPHIGALLGEANAPGGIVLPEFYNQLGAMPGTIMDPGRGGRFGRTDLSLLGPANPLGLDRNDPAGKDDITTINQLNLPVNRPVIVHLSSKDMVHSFALPQMRVKQDAVPGIAQPVWFTPTRTGQWEIACSQLCGLGHYRMRGFYTIQSQAEYDAWLAREAELLTRQ